MPNILNQYGIPILEQGEYKHTLAQQYNNNSLPRKTFTLSANMGDIAYPAWDGLNFWIPIFATINQLLRFNPYTEDFTYFPFPTLTAEPLASLFVYPYVFTYCIGNPLQIVRTDIRSMTHVIVTPGVTWGSDSGIVYLNGFFFVAVLLNPTYILKLNASTLAYTLHAMPAGAYFSGGFDTDGKYLYLGAPLSPSKIYKIDPITMTNTAYTLTAGQIGLGPLIWSAPYLYGICVMNPTTIIKYNPVSASHTALSLPADYGVTPGPLLYNGTLYLVSYASPGKIIMINPKTGDSVAITLEAGENLPTTIFTDGRSIFSIHRTAPGLIIRHNLLGGPV